MIKLLCTHCSRHAGTNKYHLGPYGGGPESKCPFDTRGIRRPGFQFISAIFDTAVNALDIPDYRDLESEGLEYENTDVNVIDRGQQLLNDAIGPYSTNE